jgi:hypothetical protein
VPSTLPTEGIEFGLLPTPKTVDIEGGKVNNVQMENGSYFRENAQGVRWGVKLRDVVENGLLPTPTVMDTNCVDLEKIDQRRVRALAKGINGNGFGMTIGELANRNLLPTPLKDDWKGGTSKERTDGGSRESELRHVIEKTVGNSSQLNPHFVMEMMGFPPDWTELPFLSGEMNQSKPEVMP